MIKAINLAMQVNVGGQLYIDRSGKTFWEMTSKSELEGRELGSQYLVKY